MSDQPRATNDIRVLLVAGQPVVSAGLRILIEREPDLTAVGELAHPKEVAARLRAAPVDVTVIDYGDEQTVEHATATLMAAESATGVVLLSSSANVAFLAQAFRRGARGLVAKHRASQGLFRAIRRVHGGDIWLDPKYATAIVTELVQRSRSRSRAVTGEALTERDLRIVMLVLRGLTNAEIASELCVSEATVRNRLTAIYRKTGVTGRMHLVVYASEHGLLDAADALTPSRPNLKLV